MTETTRRAVIVAAAGGAAACGIGGAAALWTWPVAGPARSATRRTSFGWVTLAGSTRLALGPPGASGHGSAHASRASHAGHTQATAEGVVPSAVHGAWTDAVVVDVEMHNESASPVALSPGLFRVRVDGAGETISLYDADRVAGQVRPRSTATMRIRYLVPPPDHEVSLEFADVGASAAVALGALHRDGSTGAVS
jgi:hypothetical protein